ncbi:MAG TPA: AAA family ATPase [Chthoniobacteraceae bacterium]|nr:AAA family ATPase [Chthoniobacteraceae bacterium]
MIRTVEIENFRGIGKARITDAARINIMVGPNGTGKTAFLEAMFLAGGNSPENLMKTRAFRGREGGEVQVDPRRLADFLLADAFRDPALGRASIKMMGDDGEDRSVEILNTEAATIMSPSGDQAVTEVGLTFNWEGPQGRATSQPRLVAEGLRMDMVFAGPGVHFFPARVNISERETASAFSRLSVEGREGDFVAAFLKEFPQLTDIGVEAPNGAPSLHARLPSRRKLPLTMISGGISHLAGMLIRLAANPKSVLLIDEIENGFYHDRYSSIWRTLYDMCVKNDCQIFATSHSLECLNALVDALPNHASDVRFLRSSLEDGEIAFEQLRGETFFKAIKIGEVR